MGATAAAIANAFFDATGARLQQYPMTPPPSSLRSPQATPSSSFPKFESYQAA
jgi:hypothetical protein